MQIAIEYLELMRASGFKAFYKVFVVLKTGNEKGSKTVSVMRP